MVSVQSNWRGMTWSGTTWSGVSWQCCGLNLGLSCFICRPAGLTALSRAVCLCGGHLNCEGTCLTFAAKHYNPIFIHVFYDKKYIGPPSLGALLSFISCHKMTTPSAKASLFIVSHQLLLQDHQTAATPSAASSVSCMPRTRYTHCTLYLITK